MKLVREARSDTTDLFTIGAGRELVRGTKMVHTPVLAFVVEGDALTVRPIDNVEEVLELPDDTPLMLQWRGQWRSDWFQFTVATVRMWMPGGAAA